MHPEVPEKIAPGGAGGQGGLVKEVPEALRRIELCGATRSFDMPAQLMPGRLPRGRPAQGEALPEGWPPGGLPEGGRHGGGTRGLLLHAAVFGRK